MMKRILLIVFTLFGAGMASAQDIHFSQFDASPLNLNPAFTGLFDGDFRITGNHRNQWSAVPVPYSTFSFAGEMRGLIKKSRDTYGAGLIINTDKAGDSQFSTKQVNLALSYIKVLNGDSTRFLSFGMQPGMTTRGFNTSKLTFDNQYDGDSYDPSLSSGENFTTTKMTYFDLSAGTNFLMKIKPRMNFNIGAAFMHILQPRQSFYLDGITKLDPKIAFHSNFQLPVSATMDVVPSVLYEKQGKFSETVLGAQVRFLLKSDKSDGPETAFMTGVYYRAKDAVIAYAGYTMNRITLGMSYDVNTSGLHPAVNGRGGYEISIIYTHARYIPYVAKKRVCPVYM
jgi:type IX secretion system PorP/SprF family membrane protein